MMDVVICAGGYGQIRSGFTKVCEEINGKPMILRILEKCNELKRRWGFNVTVALNQKFFGQYLRTVPDYLVYSFDTVIQPERKGTIDALERALGHTQSGSILVMYGDMPFWTLETLEGIMHQHREQRATLTFATFQLRKDSLPSICKYGRVQKDKSGRIVELIDRKEPLPAGTQVSPSLFCFEQQWLRRNMHKAPILPRPDGLSGEQSLASLIPMASMDGQKVVEYWITDEKEALGINTAEDLELARQLF